jgi:thiol-disulfide isomerase/thioredoxin
MKIQKPSSNIVRLNLSALKMLLSGDIRDKHKCIIKFYSDSCPMCHRLAPVYIRIAENRMKEDMHFFAFNVQDIVLDPSIEDIKELVEINGTPSFAKLFTGDRDIKVSILSDPKDPDPNTWYNFEQVNNFIDKEK